MPGWSLCARRECQVLLLYEGKGLSEDPALKECWLGLVGRTFLGASATNGAFSCRKYLLDRDLGLA